MDSYDIGRLTYLILLLAAVGGYFLVANRHSLGKVLQQALVWGLIFVGLLAGYGLWTDIKPDLTPRQAMSETGQVSVPRSRDGHFHLTLDLDGTPVRFIVDTGASDVVLTLTDARRIGIDPDSLTYLGSANTANGVVRTAPTRIGEVRLGSITDRNLRVYVNEGAMQSSLLGMAYLERFSRIEIADDRLILTR